MTSRDTGSGGGSQQASTYLEPTRLAHRYRLKFDQRDERPVKDIEFEAEDAFEALTIAHREARRHSAELWRDGTKLCSIARQSDELWEIVSVENYLDGR